MEFEKTSGVDLHPVSMGGPNSSESIQAQLRSASELCGVGCGVWGAGGGLFVTQQYYGNN